MPVEKFTLRESETLLKNLQEGRANVERRFDKWRDDVVHAFINSGGVVSI